jgi:hypothetical protein
MPLRSGHGAGAGRPHVEVCPVDELPAPIPAPARPGGDREATPERGDGGRFAAGPGTRALSVAANRAKARRVRLVDSLGLSEIASASTFAPYRRAAEEFVTAHLAELARTAGGTVGTGPSTLVASAALQLAASRWAFDRGAQESDASLLKLGSALANDSRQNLIAAIELAMRAAQVRQAAMSDDEAALRARILGPKEG